jgi:hypothetical protein
MMGSHLLRCTIQEEIVRLFLLHDHFSIFKQNILITVIIPWLWITITAHILSVFCTNTN